MSTVGRGTAYELSCMHMLETWLGMAMYRTGGANDRGMDLCGWWTPPTPPGARPVAPQLRIAVQCKAKRQPLGPVIVRELEGTLFRATWDAAPPSVSLPDGEHGGPVTPSGAPLVGVLAALNGFSKQAILQARTSRLPMLLLHLAPLTPLQADTTAALACHGFVWNDALAGPNGLLRARYEALWAQPTRAKAAPVLTLQCDGVAVA